MSTENTQAPDAATANVTAAGAGQAPGGSKAPRRREVPPPREQRLLLWGRRLWRHFKRRRAVIGLLLAAFAILLYYLTPNVLTSPTLADPARQFLLIMAATAASAMFLPELSANLFTLSRDEARQLTRYHQRANLRRVLIAAESDDDVWNSLVYSQALEPLLAASRDPSQVVTDMRYEVDVHPNKTAEFAGKTLSYHNIFTESSSKRVLPPPSDDGSYWISVARTEQALKREFGEPACLAREIVELEDESGKPLDGLDWVHAALQFCAVSLDVDTQMRTLERPSDNQDTDVLRWKWTPERNEIDGRVPVYITFNFPIRSTEDQFPVYFSGFYCAGRTHVSIKVLDLDPDVRLDCHTFFARGLMSQKPFDDEVPQARGCKKRYFETGDDSILWPGSGVVFDWHECSDPHP